MSRPSRTSVRREGRANQLSRQLFGRPVGQIAPASGLTVTPQKNRPLPREALCHFWHPDRLGVEQPPDDFAKKLAQIHLDLRLTRPPANTSALGLVHCWLLWVRKPSIRHALCPGWLLLLAWKYGRRPLPLDEKLFAAIYHFDARHCGNGKQYFDRILEERDRSIVAEQKRDRSNRLAKQKDWYESRKIKNIGAGSKFALHGDGTMIPSRGELNWTLERQRTQLPSELLRELKDRR